MPLMKPACIREILRVAIEMGLDRKRAAMLNNLDPAYVAGLATDPTPAAQLLLDLSAMNRDGSIADDVTPLEEWLLTAAALSSQFTSRQKFFNDKAERVARAAMDATPTSQNDGDRLPEQILFKNALLPAQFMAGALRTARSVVRLVLPQISEGVPRMSPSGAGPANAVGTGWLIGADYLITNWHVAEARAASEPRPSIEDVRQQCASATAEFDFDDQDAPPVFVRKVAALEHHQATLDYAILRLAPSAGEPPRSALPLRNSPFKISAEEPFPVNIIQHPAGAAKQLGIRNNLASALSADELTYFTDTAGGSSGAPVCDDAWRVVALHRGSRLASRRLNFQGKDTAWINTGTPIWPIIEDLSNNAASLWAEIAATVE